MAETVDDVIAKRLRIQRLTSEPLADPVDVVRLLACVQAQDAPLARFSVGIRYSGGTDESVRHAIDEGRILRTHILRPTWHLVAPDDLHWILALTSPKVESGMAARHRQLGLDAALVDRTLDAVVAILGGLQCMTRRALAAQLGEEGIRTSGEQLGHMLLLAELRGIICSGPHEGTSHTYGLVEELVAPTKPRDRADAVRELVARFYAGHGPATIADLTRWTRLTKTEVQLAVQEIGDRLQMFTADGLQLWFDPAMDAADQGSRRAFLLPVFDEAYLSYATLNMPRADGHPRGTRPHSFAEAGGGVVVLDRRDVGWWKRTNKGRRVNVSLALASTLDRGDHDVIAAAATRLATFTDREPEIHWA